MKLSDLSQAAQDGLCRFTREAIGDEMLLDGIWSLPEHWAWLLVHLKVAQDRAEWFPEGKWATIQVIEEQLINEVRAALPVECQDKGDGHTKNTQGK